MNDALVFEAVTFLLGFAGGVCAAAVLTLGLTLRGRRDGRKAGRRK